MASQNVSINNNPRQVDEIDLKVIFVFLIEIKVNINYVINLFVGACIYGLLQKRVWEGQFEIVVDNNQEKSLQNNL